MISPLLQGFGLGGSLIVAIGAQNAFVLSQSIRRNHHLPIAMVCCMGDIILVSIGVTGMGAMVTSMPDLARFIALAGALFLFWYGFGSFRSALQDGVLEAEEVTEHTLRSALLTTLGVTFLNPHAYLDTVVMVGGISSQFPGMGRYLFGAGAVGASILWFFSLALGGQMLAPVFRNPLAWKILDTCIGVIMWGIGASLMLRVLA